ncbi:MAG: hypothetical protein COB15_05600 [Flavobacteriales bacterium]|nr:MAG: hypothetical protein COB15_05600 [Flavobacteriales bacterium]
MKKTTSLIQTLCVLSLLVFTSKSYSQAVMVADIYASNSSSDPSYLTPFGNDIYFRADDGINGQELWKVDGATNNASLVLDINSGTANSYPQEFAVLGNDLYFWANDGTNGGELWKVDGTTGIASLKQDINPGTVGSYPRYFTVLSNDLYFNASGTTTGEELWKLDGATGIVSLVLDISPGTTTSFPNYKTVFGNDLYFCADDGTNGTELWKVDGTTGIASLVQDIYPGAMHSVPRELTVLGNDLYFQAKDAANGEELWKLDGTTGTASMVMDIYPGATGSGAQSLTVFGNDIYFSAVDFPSNIELWKVDGATGIVSMVQNINPGGSSYPSYLTPFGNDLYFSADDGTNGRELWKVDGTTGIVSLVQDINSGPSSSSPYGLTVFGNDLYFRADDGTNGRELWKVDGTTGIASLVQDINPTNASSDPNYLTVVGNSLYFSADDGTNGKELWRIAPACTPTASSFSVVECVTYTVPSGDETYTTLGTYSVMDTINNVAGCDSVMTISVTIIQDITNPTISCPANQVGTVGPSCNFSLPDYTGLATAADNCTGSPTVTQVPAAGTVVGVGTTNVVLTATDGSSNTANCNFDVVVSDTTAPTVVCQNILAYLDGSGNVTITPNDVDAGSIDNCFSIASLIFIDNPVELSQPFQNNNGSSVGHGQSFTAPVTGDLTSISFKVNGNSTGNTIHFYNGGSGSGTAGSVGTPIYQESGVTYVDATGGSTWTTVQLSTPLSVISGNSYSFILDGTSDIYYAGDVYAGGQFIWNYDASSGCCAWGDIAFQLEFGKYTSKTYTCADAGSNSVTLSVTDGSNNSSNCVGVVTVLDTISPILSCPVNQVGTVDASCNFSLPDYTGLATATDNCSGIVVTQVPAAGTVVGVGTTNIVLTATDGSSNTANCNFDVVVSDGINPTISCPANQVGTVDASCNFSLPDYTGLATATDNCSGVVVTQVPAAGTVVGVGTTNIVLTATDGSTNTANCNFDVVVSDATNPTISCPGNVATCNPVVTGIAPTASDNCSGVTVTYTLSGVTTGSGSADASGTTFNVGTTTVTYLATDGNSNTTSCNFDVVINAADDASFNYASSTFCLTGSNPTPTITGLGSGSFSGTGGLSINTVTGEIDLATTGVGGPFTVTYTTTGTCPNSSNVNVSVTTAPDATFSYTGTPYCAIGTTTVTFGAGASAGVFSATPSTGLSINTASGEVNLATSTPGTYTVANDIAAAGGCASASANSSITINAIPVANPTALVGCDSLDYNGTMYYISTMVNDTSFAGAFNGCDSITNQQVTINSVDVTVNNASPALTANATGATYQWLDCNNNMSVIPGATNASYTVTVNGSYAVVVTQNGCTDTSACIPVTVTGVNNDQLLVDNYKIYPNPSKGIFTVSLDQLDDNSSIIVYSVVGAVIINQQLNSKQTIINLEAYGKGIYFVKITNGDNTITQRIVKQ